MRYLEWEKAQPSNWLTADQNLQRTVEFYMGSNRYRERLPALYQFGQTAAISIYKLVSTLPNIDAHIQIQKHIHDAGLVDIAAYEDSLSALSLFYLSAQNGEIGVHLHAIQTTALINLLSQIVTAEGESDKVQNILTQLQSTESYNNNASILFDGEYGYGLNTAFQFLIDDSDTLIVSTGTDSIDLHQTIGFHQSINGFNSSTNNEIIQIGKKGQGSIYWDDIVKPTLQLYTSVACAAHLRHAYLIAWRYAATIREQHASHYLIHNPHLHAPLTEMRANAVAVASGSFHIAKLRDKHTYGKADDPDLPAVIQMATALHAFCAPQLAIESIEKGMVILGSSGIVESFSPLPRLLRDTISYRTWYGRPTTIMSSLQNECQQFAMYLPFLSHLQSMFGGITVPEIKQDGLQACDQIKQELEAILKLPDTEASVYFTPLMIRLTDLFYVACLAVEGSWERVTKQDRTKQRLAEFILKQRVTKIPLGQWREYPTWISRLCHEIRPARVDWKEDTWLGSDDPLWE